VAEPSKTKTLPPATAADERRRIGRVVHDDRGNASVSWQDAPADYERPVLELAETATVRRAHEGIDPYARANGRPGESAARPVKRGRTDLRKLSEHIKMMRELEARRRAGSHEDSED
jgi:hypothetical protein